MTTVPAPQTTPRRKAAGATAPAASLMECRYCHQWESAVDDMYCAFCGRLLLMVEIEPESLMLISSLAPRREIVIRNTGATTTQLSIVPRDGSGFSALRFEPASLSVPPNGEARVAVILDAGLLPDDFRERAIDYVCVDSAGRERALSITVRSAPRPKLITPLIDFGNVEDGRTVERSLQIMNTGGTPLRIATVVAQGTPRLRVNGEIANMVIQPGAKAAIPIVWEGKGDVAGSDDAATGIRVEFGNYSEAAFVPVRAQVFRYKLDVKPASIRIRDALAKREYPTIVRLENAGTTDVDVVAIESSDAWIAVVSRATAFTVLCGASAAERAIGPTTFLKAYELTIVCRPKGLAKGKHAGKVTIRPHGQDPIVIPVEITVVIAKAYEDYIGIDFGTTNSVVAVMSRKQTIELAKEASGETLIPSVLVFDDAETFKIGSAARSEAPTAPDRTVRSIKRVMGYESERHFFDVPFSSAQLASLIIRKLVELAETQLFEETGRHYEVRRAIITVPANFYDLQIHDVLEACRAAGLDVEAEGVRRAEKRGRAAVGESINAGVILDEPSAAVLYYTDLLQRTRGDDEISRAIARPAGLKLLVFDYGGGTLDVSVASVSRVADGGTGLRILANMGDNAIGGDTIDLILMRELLRRCSEESNGFVFDTKLIEDNFRDIEARCDREGWSMTTWREVLSARSRWKDIAESIKKRAAEPKQAQVEVMPDLIVRVVDGALVKAPKSVRIDAPPSDVIAALLQNVLKRCGELIDSALALAGVAHDEIDYILHTGRQSMLPHIRDAVRERFPKLGRGCDILEEEHLKYCVAKGAALYGALRGGLSATEARIYFLNEGRRLPHSYGVEKRGIAMRAEFEEIIPRGTTYPLEITRNYPPELIPPTGILNLKFYQNSGASKAIAGNPDITLLGRISIDTNEDDRPGCDVTLAIGPNRTLDILADGKRVEIDRAQLHEEEGWSG